MMLIIHLLLPGFVLLLGRVLLLWFRPERDCRWCRGRGRRPAILAVLIRRKRPPVRRCWRCKGDGHTWRLGARLVRSAHMSALRAWLEWRYTR